VFVNKVLVQLSKRGFCSPSFFFGCNCWKWCPQVKPSYNVQNPNWHFQRGEKKKHPPWNDEYGSQKLKQIIQMQIEFLPSVQPSPLPHTPQWRVQSTICLLQQHKWFLVSCHCRHRTDYCCARPKIACTPNPWANTQLFYNLNQPQPECEQLTRWSGKLSISTTLGAIALMQRWSVVGSQAAYLPSNSQTKTSKESKSDYSLCSPIPSHHQPILLKVLMKNPLKLFP